MKVRILNPLVKFKVQLLLKLKLHSTHREEFGSIAQLYHIVYCMICIIVVYQIEQVLNTSSEMQ